MLQSGEAVVQKGYPAVKLMKHNIQRYLSIWYFAMKPFRMKPDARRCAGLTDATIWLIEKMEGFKCKQKHKR